MAFRVVGACSWRYSSAHFLSHCSRQLAPGQPFARQLVNEAPIEISRVSILQKRSASAVGRSPMRRYEELVAAGEITRDDLQVTTVRLLDDLCKQIAHYKPVRRPPVQSTVTAATPSSSSSSSGWLGGLFGGSSNSASNGKPSGPAPKPQMTLPRPTVPGLYLHGGCGTGKSFLMDLFYDVAPVEKKRRIHFHEWMIDVHERLHRLQKSKAMVQAKANTVWTAEAAKAQRTQLKSAANEKHESADDLVEQVADEMMKDAWLLCFDEFQVTHISDAIIMKRLFSVLFEKGAVVVATSNRPPEDLYLNGLNRPLFLPFIPMLKQFCKVHDIASSHDYRLATAGEDDDRRLYIFPNGKEEKKLLERKFYRLCQGEVNTGIKVQTQGRTVVVPKAAVNTNVAWFRFKDLCDKPLGAGDYLAICAEYHTVFIADIPKLTLQERDQVRRFITLIDTFYERHTRLICTADREPYTLFEVADSEKENTVMDEIFAWDRTVSRLIEMQSIKYQTQIARSIPGEQFLGQFDLKAIADDECEDLWRRYDVDENGILCSNELKFMFEDLVEVNKGHRSLTHVNVEDCIKIVDSDSNGVVDFQDFQMFVKDYGKMSSMLKL